MQQNIVPINETAIALNRFIVKNVKMSKRRDRKPVLERWYDALYTHFIPQYRFVHDERDGTKVVDHVIHFENLEREFSELMDQYQLNLTLPPHETHKSGKGGLDRKSLDPGVMLTDDTVAVINEYYAKDFETFGFSLL